MGFCFVCLRSLSLSLLSFSLRSPFSEELWASQFGVQCLATGHFDPWTGGGHRPFLLKQLPAAEKDTVRVNQNSKFAAGQLNTELKFTISFRSLFSVSSFYKRL